MQKFSKIILAIVLVFSFSKSYAVEVSNTPKINSGFRDVGGSHVYYDAIAFVKYIGVVKGYSDGTFRPSAPINRAEFTKIIMSSLYPSGTIAKCDVKKIKFKDIELNSWYTPYVCLAVEKGIINGYPDNTFRPAWNIQFTESSKIIASAFKLPIGTSNIWYKPFIQALADASAIPQTVKGLTHKITRSEMSEMIYRLKNKITSNPTSPFIQTDKKSSPNPVTPHEINPVKKITNNIRFKDGWFMATGSFLNTKGKASRMSVEVTLEKGLVKSLEVKPRAGDPATYSYIQIFNNDIQSSVLGKNLDDIILPSNINKKTSIGAAFFSILVEIKDQAKK